MQAIYRILVLREVHGFTTQLWPCCCPDIMRTRRYRDDYRLSREARKAVPMTQLPPPPPRRNSSLDTTTSTLKVPTLSIGVINPNILHLPPKESSATFTDPQRQREERGRGRPSTGNSYLHPSRKFHHHQTRGSSITLSHLLQHTQDLRGNFCEQGTSKDEELQTAHNFFNWLKLHPF